MTTRHRPMAWLGALALAVCASCVVSPSTVAWTPNAPTSHICRDGSVLECRAACDGGDWDACYALAQMYRNGQRVPQNTGDALALLERACDAGQNAACMQLGWTWTNVDDARAVPYLARACRHLALACTTLLQRLDANPGLMSQEERIALLQGLCTRSADSDACGRLKDMGVAPAESSP